MTTAILPTHQHEQHEHVRTKRLSLQPPAGIPQIPRSPSRTPTSATFAASVRRADKGQQNASESDGARGRRVVHGDNDDEDVSSDESGTVAGLATRRESDASTASDDTSSDVDENTLMGCMMHLSVSSLPPIPCAESGGDAVRTGENGDVHLTKQGIPCGPLITRFPAPPKPTPSSALGTREQQRKVYLGPKLSDRATGGPDAGPLIERFSCLFKDQYHCQSNPKGIVSMGVAENFMMQAECIKMFTTALEQGLRSTDLSYGDNLWGSRRLNAALAEYYNQYFYPAIPVLPEHLITGNGCSAVLDQLFYSLMDEGEAVLVAAPYYTGFDRDLIPRARVRLVPVEVGISDPAFEPGCMDKFTEKLDELKAEGVITRAVILCNPQNPLGRTYPRSTLIAYAKWCEANDVHLVSDEIYAMSVYDSLHPASGQQEGFTSVLSLRDEELGEGYDRARLHVVYGMSKDFCANGLRVGSLVSQANPMLLRTMANTSMLMKISSPADIIWSHILSSPSLLTSFLAENKRRLTEAHAFVCDWFAARGVRVSYSNAGNFVWVNLGEVAGIKSAKQEKRVFQRLLDGGVYIAPGMAYHCNEPGWFRVTFTIARDDLLHNLMTQVGLAKIEDILGLKIKA